MKRKYKILSPIIVYPGFGGWRFLALSRELSREIKNNFGQHAKGWGSLPVIVKINKTKWTTSIFPDKKSDTYLLPLKAKIRKVECIYDDDKVNFILEIMVK